MPIRKATFGFCVVLISSAIYISLNYITNLITSHVKKPYMDEIFHVPQAQRYCLGNFSYYDSKITTPPGLYIASTLRLYIRDTILFRKNIRCDLLDLRRTNHLFALCNFIIVVMIRLTLQPNRDIVTQPEATSNERFQKLDETSNSHYIRYGAYNELIDKIKKSLSLSSPLELLNLLLTSLSITLLPPLFFFNSLYYTDSGSLYFVLLTYFFSINNLHTLSAISGLISILFRQTNIVWVFYCASLVLFKTISDYKKQLFKLEEKDANTSRIKVYLLNNILISRLIRNCLPYGIIGLAFVIFVYINNGIVLGDKDAHQAGIHIAQFLYYLGFITAFGASWVFSLSVIKRFLYFTVRSPLIVAILLSIIVCIIRFNRYAHPYLLADNRHLTFYIWRRILGKRNSYIPYLLSPIYLIGGFSIWHYKRQFGATDLLLYICCTILAVVPNGLLEFRYFIIPFIFIRLKAQVRFSALFAELFYYLLINFYVYYLFLQRTFLWANSTELQRIMW